MPRHLRHASVFRPGIYLVFGLLNLCLANLLTQAIASPSHLEENSQVQSPDPHRPSVTNTSPGEVQNISLTGNSIPLNSPGKKLPFAAEEYHRTILSKQRASVKPIPSVSNEQKNYRKRSSLAFEENLGQVDDRVRFLSRAPGCSLFLTKDAQAVFAVRRPKPIGKKQALVPEKPSRSAKNSVLQPRTGTQPSSTNAPIFSSLRMRLANSNTPTSIKTGQQLSGEVNYLLGANPKKWQHHVKRFGSVAFRGVYSGVDLLFHTADAGDAQRLEYDFHVAPGADAKQIALFFDGASRLRVNSKGDLIVSVKGGGDITEMAPVSYQVVGGRQKRVTSRYVVAPSVPGVPPKVRFALGEYNPALPLIIDPVLVYSTLVGGDAAGTRATGIAADSNGCTYIVGSAELPDFPTTIDAAQTVTSSMFVSKLSADGTSLVYATYLGGTDQNLANGIAVDTLGCAYIAGQTLSTDFPTTVGVVQSVNNAPSGSPNGFLTKVSADGSSFIYSTYLGGSYAGSMGVMGDSVSAVTVDSQDCAYVTGWAFSTDYPTTSGVVQSAKAGGQDASNAFVSKISADGTSLLSSTFLGGSDDAWWDGGDRGTAIALGQNGAIYLAGTALSADFPTTSGSYQQTQIGNYDGFVAKINDDGSTLLYSTHVGGSDHESLRGLAVDQYGSAYIVGQTYSTDIPTSVNSLQPVMPGSGPQCGFVEKLSADGSALAYATYLGGSNGYDAGNAIAVDSNNYAYVTGYVGSGGLPTTPGAFMTNGPGGDAFLTKLNSDATAALYSTYIGGGYDDCGTAIALNPSGSKVFVAGYSASADFPTTTGSLRSANPDWSYYAFVTGFDVAPSTVTVAIDGPLSSHPAGDDFYVTGTTNEPGAVILIQLVDENGNVIAEAYATVMPDGTWSVIFRNIPAGSYTTRPVVNGEIPPTGGSSSPPPTTPILINPVVGLRFTLALSSNTVVGGDTATATITLSAPAPAGTRMFYSVEGDPGLEYVSHYNSFFIPTGDTTYTFDIPTEAVETVHRAFIHAGFYEEFSDQIHPQNVTLFVVPDGDTDRHLSLNIDGSVVGGYSARGEIVLSQASSSPTTVNLSSDNPGLASVPPQIIIPAGETRVSFAIPTRVVSDYQSVDIYANSFESATATVAISPPSPKAIIGLIATPISASGESSVKLSWDKNLSAKRYVVYLSMQDSAEIQIATIDANDSDLARIEFEDTAAFKGTVLTYSVAAVNMWGEGSRNSASTTVTLDAPAAPAGLTIVGGDSIAEMVWNESSDASSYKIYRRLLPNGTFALAGTSTQPNFTDSSLTNGQEYEYTVAGVNNSGTGQQSLSGHVVPNLPAHTLQQITQIALDFYTDASGNSAPAIPTAVFPAPIESSRKSYNWRRRWLVHLEGQADIEVADDSGNVVYYRALNTVATSLQLSQSQATARADALLISSGSLQQFDPAEIKSDQRATSDGDGTTDIWRVGYRRLYQSTPVLGSQALLSVSGTGTVEAFAVTEPYADPTSVTEILTQQDAVDASESRLSAHSVQSLTFDSALKAVVRPNGYWFLTGDQPLNDVSRVAWVCFFTQPTTVPTGTTSPVFEVWIDAETGTVLGGGYQVERSRGVSRTHPSKALLPKRQILKQPLKPRSTSTRNVKVSTKKQANSKNQKSIRPKFNSRRTSDAKKK
jgi:hypothetical protein